MLGVQPQQSSQVLWRVVRHKVLCNLASGDLPTCLNINELDHVLLSAAVTLTGHYTASSLKGRQSTT